MRAIMSFYVTALAAICLSAPAAAESLRIKIEATQVIDLTHAMHEGMAYWPGGVPFRMDKLVDYPSGYLLHKFEVGENTGTHVDAPAHFIQGNRTIEQLPLRDLVVRAVVIDVRDKVKLDPDYRVSAADVRSWEEKHGRIQAGVLVIANTGWHARFGDPERYVNADAQKVMHFPGYGKDAVEVLIERDVVGIGIDTLSIDHGPSKDFAAHVAMLKANKYQIENMANLDALPPTGAVVSVAVLPVKGGSQAQARIFAFLP